MTNNNSNIKNTTNADWDVCKFLIFVLRHKPQVARLKLDDNGFTEIDKIISYLNKVRKININKEQLVALTKKHMQKTVEVKGDLIRAKFGHSVILNMNVPEEYKQCFSVPRSLFASVDVNSIFVIMKNGLSSGSLKSKLFDDFDKVKQSANHTTIVIDSEKAVRENVSFYLNATSNDYYISFVPAKFLHIRIK